MHRIANISQLDAEERAGKALKKTELEYAVRGHFLMSKHQCWGLPGFQVGNPTFGFFLGVVWVR